MLTVIMFGGMGSRYHVRYKVCYIKYSNTDKPVDRN